ncbi:MAG: hypothetical protein ACYC6Y_15075 [Thermoguttaceae bacterium]
MPASISSPRLLQASIAAVVFGAASCGIAQAHSMNVYAYVEQGQVRGEVFARGGGAFVGVTVTAYGPAGEKLGQARTGDAGEFSLAATRRCAWRLVAVTDDGHEAQYTVSAEEFAPDAADDGRPAPLGADKGPDASVSAAPGPAAKAPPSGDPADLGRQIAALRKEIHLLQQRLRWQDLVGGIGYIVGLMGLAFYFLGVRKRDRRRDAGNGSCQPVDSATGADSAPPQGIDR